MTTLTLESVKNALALAEAAANRAGMDSYAQIGERDCCGFAWVDIHNVKGNTKLGKLLKAAGVRQDWKRAFNIWSPGSIPTQSITPKEEAARAFADVLRTELGLDAYAGSRLD